MAAERTTELRTDYRYLMGRAARGTFDQHDAIELIHVCLELGRAGWTLNEGETDWLPPSTEEADHDDT